MLDKNIVVEKFIFFKEKKELVIKIFSTKYIEYEKYSLLLENLKDKYKFSSNIKKISLDITHKDLDLNMLDFYVQDAISSFFLEFELLAIFKSLSEYKIFDRSVEVFLPIQVTRLVEPSALDSFFINTAKRLNIGYQFKLSFKESPDADKLLEKSYESILKEPIYRPEIVPDISDEEFEKSEDIKSSLKIMELSSDIYKVLLEGKVTYFKEIDTQYSYLIEFGLKDSSGSIVCKKFFNKGAEAINNYIEILSQSRLVYVKGKHQLDRYKSEYFINVDSVKEINITSRQDKSKVKRIEFNFDTNAVNVDLLLETISKWKHTAFGVLPQEDIYSFLEVNKKILGSQYNFKPIYSAKLPVLMSEDGGVYNLIKRNIDYELCIALTDDKRVNMLKIKQDKSIEKIFFNKEDLVGISNFCKDMPLYYFSEALEDTYLPTLVKSGLFVLDIKRIFEVIDNKRYTSETFLLMLGSSLENLEKVGEKIVNLLSKHFTNYSDIPKFIAKKDWAEKDKYKSYNVSLTVKTKEGLKNLYRLISKNKTDWEYIPRSYLQAYRKGLFIGSYNSEGEIYSLLFSDVSKELLDARMEFYDYINILSDNHLNRLVAGNLITKADELRNINKFLCERIYKSNVLGIVSSFPNNLDKEEFKTTNELLEEFSYLEKSIANRVIVENPNILSKTIETIVPIKKFYEIEDVMENAKLMQLDDESEEFKKEINQILKERKASLVILLKEIMDYLTKNQYLYYAESMPFPYIFSMLCKDCLSGMIPETGKEFKLHVPAEYILEIEKLLLENSDKYRPFFVKFDKYTVIHFLYKGYSIYDFTPVKIEKDEIVTYFSADILKEYFPTIYLKPNQDLTMISNLNKWTKQMPDYNTIEAMDFSKVYEVTPDPKLRDVIETVKPIVFQQFLGCLGLAYGKGTWFDNGKDLLRQRLAEVLDIICFEEDIERLSQISEMHKEAARKIEYAITNKEALIHAKNLLTLKWYQDNYPQEFALEYINRYKNDRSKYINLFKIEKSDVLLSGRDNYVAKDDFKTLIEPLEFIGYLSEEEMNTIYNKRPFVSLEDFLFKTGISLDLKDRLQRDGYLRSIDVSSQVIFDI